MKIFNVGPRSAQTLLIRELAQQLSFLEGRTERYEGVSVRLESRSESVTVRVGDRERHTIAYHSRDNTWTVSFYPRDPWLDGGVQTMEAGPFARSAFVNSVLYSLRACRQIDGAPMITQAEEARLLVG